MGSGHTCAGKLDGSVNCWGLNGRGQIEDGVSPTTLPTSGTPLPAVVMNLTHAVQLTSGFDHGCALKRDRTRVCWGANETSHLGDRTRNDRSAPEAVVGGVIFQSSPASPGNHKGACTAARTSGSPVPRAPWCEPPSTGTKR